METYVTQVQFNGSGLPLEQPDNVENSIKQLVEEEDGRLIDIYPILGSHSTDLIAVCTFPNTRAAFKTWMGLATRFGWRTQTNVSLSKQDFQQVHQSILSVAASAVPSGSGTRSTTAGR